MMEPEVQESFRDRRQFIRMAGFLTVSAAGLILSGCGEDDDNRAGPKREPLAAGSWNFPSGVMSGDPRPDSIVLWTEIARTPSNTGGGDIEAVLQVSRVAFDDPAFKEADLVLAHPITAQARFGHTLRHRVEKLAPGTRYWYRFIVDHDRSIQGRTKTAPAADATPKLRFAYLSCQDWSANHWEAYTILARREFDDLDFIVHLGDYIYETADAGTFQSKDAEPRHRTKPVDPARLSGVKPNGTRYAQSLEDYRYLYRHYRSDERLQAVNALFPVIAIWDDHEFTDDAWSGHETYTDLNDDQSGRRRAANQAWFEFMPVTVADVSFSPDQINDHANIRIYRDFAFGKTLHLIMTDERLYRHDHAVPENTGRESIEAYLGQVLRNLGDLTDPNGLYQSLSGFLESVIDRLLNPETPLSPDALNPRPTVLSLVRMLTKTPIADDVKLSVRMLLTMIGQADPRALLNLAARDGVALGSRYAVLKEVYDHFAALDRSSGAAMLGAEQTRWLQQTMRDAQDRGAVWKVWGNEVGMANMQLDLNRIRNLDLALPGALGFVSFVFAGLVASMKYAMTTEVVRQRLAKKADGSAANLENYNTDGSATTAPGQTLIAFADCWDGYQPARDTINGFLAAGGVTNLVAITGDLHTFSASQIRDRRSGRPVMLEFMGAGVSSNSFGGFARALPENEALSGLRPLLTGRGTPAGMLAGLVQAVTTRPDRSNDARDLFGRFLMHFSDEVRWAEGIGNGFATMELDAGKAEVVFHNLRVERDPAGLVLDATIDAKAADINRAYERRSRFTVHAAGTVAPESSSVWPEFPTRITEYENPAAIPTPTPTIPVDLDPAEDGGAAGPLNISGISVGDQRLAARVRSAVRDSAARHPDNPYAELMLGAVR